MLNHDFDPFQKLEELYIRDAVHEHNVDQMGEKLGEACDLLEQMAAQVKHLTNAVIGLQKMNKILYARLERMENQDD